MVKQMSTDYQAALHQALTTDLETLKAQTSQTLNVFNPDLNPFDSLAPKAFALNL